MIALRLRTLALGSVAALVAALGAMLAVPGCTVVTTDVADDTGTYEGGTADAAPSACGACVAQECLGTWAVCLTDDACQKLRGCANPFGESQGARDECFCAGAVPSDGGDGVDPLAAYTAFASCNDSRTCSTCSADCTSSCPKGAPQTSPKCAGSDAGTDAADAGDAGDAAPAEGPSVDRCADCVSGKCGDAKKLCAIGSECAAFLVCANGCSDATCVDACGKSHATGKAGAKDLSSCTLTSCRSACGL